MQRLPIATPRYSTVGALELLRADVHQLGLYHRPTGRLILELLFALAISLGGAAFAIFADGIVSKIAWMIVSTAGTLGVATGVHTASHNAFSEHEWVNKLIGYLGYSFFLNQSFTAWQHSHIAIHHRAPNIMEIDGDCDLMPAFAITRPQFEATRGAARLYYRLQWIFLPLALSLDGFNRQFCSWRYLISVLRDPDRRRLSHYIDLAAMSGYWVVWFVLPMIFISPLEVLTFNAARIGLMGYALFAAFGPGHFPAEATCFTIVARPTDFYERQLHSTVNFRNGPLRQFFLCGLQFQIEHHLFPGIPHCHYPALRPLVKRFAEQQGFPYSELGWLSAIWKSYQVFITPKDVVGEPCGSFIVKGNG
jgi:linoleoyl-CoA desaturase